MHQLIDFKWDGISFIFKINANPITLFKNGVPTINLFNLKYANTVETLYNTVYYIEYYI